MASFDKILDTELLHEHQGDEIEGGNIGKVIPIESIYFDKNATGANQESMVAWNSATGHLEIGMAGGNVIQEVGSEIYVPRKVTNDDTTDMPDGTIVYISGITGVNFKVKKADYTSENTSALVIAVMTEYTAVGQKGWATSFGEVNGLNTLGETSGAIVYLGANGTWTTTKPSAPNHIVKIGNIGRVHATEGSILVSISNGWEIDELHNVAISGLADNNILQYELSTGLWKNKPLTGTGDVVGPASSIDGNIVLFDGITGKLIKDSGSVLSSYQLKSEKGVANGYASLDSSAKVPVAQLPSSIMEYKGSWNASTNTPTLADGTGDNGDVYRVSVAGTVNLGSGSITFSVGDFVIYNGSIWQRSPAGGTAGFTYSQIDASGGSSDTYGILSGTINGSNKVFTTSYGSYVSGSLQVYLNGQLQTQGTAEDWQETIPASGTFTFTTAPVLGDEIIATYKYSTSVGTNADTVDGYEASAFYLKTEFGQSYTTLDFGASGDVTKTQTVNIVGITSTSMIVPTILAEPTTNNSADDILTQPLEVKVTNVTTNNFDIVVNSLVGIFNYEVKVGFIYIK